MEFNVDDINIDNLELSTRGLVMSYALKGGFYDNLAITDEMFSWALNPPPIYAAAGDDIKKRAEQHARAYTKNRPGSLKITRLVKKEFYDFLCTESEYYKKERSIMGGNVNALITGVWAAIATKLGNVEIGVATSFVTCFMIVLTKMGKRAMCEYCKSTE